MDNPSKESFLASKSMVLVCTGILAIITLVALGVAVEVLWQVNVFELVAAGIAGITGQSAQGVYRNVKSDTPVRYLNAQMETNVVETGVFGPPGLPGG